MIIGIVGEEGTGKTTALRKLDPTKTFVIKPNNKPFPWSGWRKDYKAVQTKKNAEGKITAWKGNYVQISTLKEVALWSKRATLKKDKEGNPVFSNVVIEDITHLFNNEILNDEFMGRKEGGEARAKWNEFGKNVLDWLIRPQSKIDREDYTCFMFFHSEEYEGTTGPAYRLKVSGSISKGIPSYFTYFFYTKVYSPEDVEEKADRYRFVTNRDGYRPAKSSDGVFPLEIPNDLQMVRDRILAYEMGEELPELKVKQHSSSDF